MEAGVEDKKKVKPNHRKPTPFFKQFGVLV